MTPETEFQGITSKYLRREFVLPEWMDFEQMTYRIRDNGVLRITFPCQRESCPNHYGTKQQQQQWKPVKRV